MEQSDWSKCYNHGTSTYTFCVYVHVSHCFFEGWDEGQGGRYANLGVVRFFSLMSLYIAVVLSYKLCKYLKLYV